MSSVHGPKRSPVYCGKQDVTAASCAAVLLWRDNQRCINGANKLTCSCALGDYVLSMDVSPYPCLLLSTA